MRKSIATLHYLTQDLPDRTHQEQVRIACEAGVKWIQLRVKKPRPDKIGTAVGREQILSSNYEWLMIAEAAKKICDQYRATLVINDSVSIAKAVNADGVHLGQEDESVEEARKILGEEKIIGCSTHSLEDLLTAKNFEVDYFGLGPFRFTSTKENLDAFLGLEGIKKIIQQARIAEITKPIIAIGGIQLNDVHAILEAGADGVAVSSAINLSHDPVKAGKEFLKQLSHRDSFGTNKLSEGVLRTNNFKLETEA
ncbi:MAG TPA: thiamine phosphate synthase [Chitinophagales bacterium]|nr:thiamine phosphate synthase [Chitinophagales bacterium]